MNAGEIEIGGFEKNKQDFISLRDIARYRDPERTDCVAMMLPLLLHFVRAAFFSLLVRSRRYRSTKQAREVVKDYLQTVNTDLLTLSLEEICKQYNPSERCATEIRELPLCADTKEPAALKICAQVAALTFPFRISSLPAGIAYKLID